jgi:hypothetical protein
MIDPGATAPADQVNGLLADAFSGPGQGHIVPVPGRRRHMLAE